MARLTERPLRYHFSGLAGAGMNPLAQLMRARGHAVQGSDRSFDQGKGAALAARLAGLGIVVKPQDGSAITAGLDRFVYSTAVEAETPEVRAARAHGIERIPRPALLAEVVDAGRPGVAIAGTSGKSTITGMVGWLTREAGLAATVLGGAALAGEGGSSCFLLGAASGPVAARTYGVAPGADARLEIVSVGPHRAAGVLHTTGGPLALDVPQPGRHNLENGAAAALIALDLGLAPATVTGLLARFPGVARRFEVVAVTPSGIRVVDDYAHNGEKLRAAITTAQAGADRVLAVFQPHGFGPARFLRPELAEMMPRLLRSQDRLCYAEIFYAGGTVARDMSSRVLAEDLPPAMECGYAPDHRAVVAWARERARPGDTVLVMGARDPELPALARAVAADLP